MPPTTHIRHAYERQRRKLESVPKVFQPVPIKQNKYGGTQSGCRAFKSMPCSPPKEFNHAVSYTNFTSNYLQSAGSFLKQTVSYSLTHCEVQLCFSTRFSYRAKDFKHLKIQMKGLAWYCWPSLIRSLLAAWVGSHPTSSFLMPTAPLALFLTRVNCFFSSGYSLSYPRHQARKVNTWQRHNRQNGLDLCLKHEVSSLLWADFPLWKQVHVYVSSSSTMLWIFNMCSTSAPAQIYEQICI